MRLSERLSGIIYRMPGLSNLQALYENSPEKVLARSLKILDSQTIQEIKDFTVNSQTQSGGFRDKGGRADMYYSLFGFFLADALDLKDVKQLLAGYIATGTDLSRLDGIHLHCAAIMAEKLDPGHRIKSLLRKRIRRDLKSRLSTRPVYGNFLHMLTCFYVKDYTNLFFIRNQLNTITEHGTYPCPVTAALLVLRQSFGKVTDDLKRTLFSYYDNMGGFKATCDAPVADLLSTGVALYALRFSGSDLRLIKPDCLTYVDNLYLGGGFGANMIDSEPDIEYTFYALLGLGALA